MNKTSVVIDGHTVSYWKYQLIDKLYKENNLKKIYITNHKSFNRAFSLVRFLCKNLFKINISELFEEIERISIIENSQYSGSLIWLSEITELRGQSAESRIRTYEGVAGRFTVCSLWPLGHLGITIKSL